MYKLGFDLGGVSSDYLKILFELSKINVISNVDEFNDFCKKVCFVWAKFRGENRMIYKKFSERLANISPKNEMSIVTNWGGVDIVKREDPLIEKYLVVKKGKYLSFEKHAEKVEDLEVIEGEGVLLKREGDEVKVKILKPGVKDHFDPGVEHCVIACEDLLIFEKSMDYKGMDQDLIFIYEPLI